MKKSLASGLILVMILAVQGSRWEVVEIFGIAPDYLLVFVLYVAITRGSMEALLWGLAAGLLQDTLSGGIIGFNLIAKPVTGYAVGLLNDKLDFDNPNTQTLVALAASLFNGILVALLVSAYQPEKTLGWSLGGVVLPEAVCNALLLPLVQPAGRLATALMRSWKRRYARIEE